ncbi:CDT1-like protein a, chloroplastic [Iris pallida]|uniref:CDT1-like protein a, chloroplastic n=1 Tax=Iris pallida TaxID=29817 RepID=A0AAX6IBV6_IRIPA|nr:CDT1-like protein a, chloroplastic [Iris pallida]
MASIYQSKKKNPSTTPIKSQPFKHPASISASIATPEKSAEPRTRRVAMSVKEVEKVAEGLGRNKKGSASGSGGDLPPPEVPEPPRARTPVGLPEKYDILAEFFNSMEISIRLIRMKGLSPTFPNICSSIQNLTDRRFTYEHLAQLKYILPEAIVVKKVLLHDEVTCCLKQDLHVTLQVDAIGSNDDSEHLRRVFRERLVNFSKQHPEGEDIPEDQLPHPFNQTKPSICLNGYSLSKPSPDSFPQEQFAGPSHMSRSFQRRFSQKVPISDSQKTPLACYNKALSEDGSLDSVASSPVKCILQPPLSKESLLDCPVTLSSASTLVIHEEEAKKPTKADDKCKKKLQDLDGTPAKLVSTPVRLMAATPEIQTPKRCRSTMDFNSPPMDLKSPPLKKSTKRSTRTQLFATPTKNSFDGVEESKAEGTSADDVVSYLPESLLQSVREKERKALEEKDAGAVEEKRRQKLIAGLPNIFDMIILMFQSWSRSVMTKQELIYKLIANNFKIVDRGEVEEQLKLLQELVPEWISEKSGLSGDILCCVNKISSPEEIRQRLAEAE